MDTYVGHDLGESTGQGLGGYVGQCLGRSIGQHLRGYVRRT